ncbi:Protein sidekick-2 [Anas platyrhynchos]|uniref:Protein sidekick-2 n=1 Tax=Anas platyrhynchos TaxID=8839 RepID=R0M712_ANAPL|nr:Protein sidekick-2 [Anas platyrhynchos]
MQTAGHQPSGKEKESNSTDYSHPRAATCEILPSPFSHWGTLNAGGLNETVTSHTRAGGMLPFHAGDAGIRAVTFNRNRLFELDPGNSHSSNHCCGSIKVFRKVASVSLQPCCCSLLVIVLLRGYPDLPVPTGCTLACVPCHLLPLCSKPDDAELCALVSKASGTYRSPTPGSSLFFNRDCCRCRPIGYAEQDGKEGLPFSLGRKVCMKQSNCSQPKLNFLLENRKLIYSKNTHTQPDENEDLNSLYFREDSCNCLNLDFPLCKQLPDDPPLSSNVGQDDIQRPNTTSAVLERIQKLFKRNTSSPSITIERKNLFMQRSASIWIAVNYAHDSCVKGKNISLTPSKAGKCLTPSNINAHQITNQLKIKWDMPATPTQYELRYREALTETTQWTLEIALSDTIENMKIKLIYMSACLPIFLCLPELMSKPRISYNATTEISPGRRSVRLKWEGTDAVVTWTPEYSPKCFVVDWGTCKEDMRMKIVTTPAGNFTLDNLKPHKLYKIMVHASDVCQCENFTRHEKTFGVTHFYSVEGGPTNVTMLNITKHSALVKWTEIAAEDCLGFLQGYRISYTDSSGKKWLAASVNSSTTSYRLTGLKEKTIYRVQISGFTNAGEGLPTLSQPFSTLKYDIHKQPLLHAFGVEDERQLLLTQALSSSPRASSACTPMVTNWKPISKSLLQAMTDNDTTSLYVIEHEAKVPLKLEHFTDGVEVRKCDTCQSKESTNNIDINIRHKEIPEKTVTSEKEGIISITVPLLSDYTSMEFSQKALMSLTVKLPARVAHPNLEMELRSKPARTEHQVLFAPQDYLKQSQVVFLPSVPTLMGQVNLN